MAKLSTVKIVGDLLTCVAPRFRIIQDVAEFQAIIPYQTIVVQDEVSNIMMGQSSEFMEHRLYLMERSVHLATIDLAFHNEQGLVNYSYFVIPREWFKRKAIMNSVKTAVYPYLRNHHPNAPIVPQMQDVYLFSDDKSGMIFQVRTYVSTPEIVGIGVAIIDSNYA